MKKEEIQSIFNDNFLLYRICQEGATNLFLINHKIFEIYLKNGKRKFCLILSHSILWYMERFYQKIEHYDFYQVMCDIYNVLMQHLYSDNYIMSLENWSIFTGKLKQIDLNYQSDVVRELIISCIEYQEEIQNMILLRKKQREAA